ncbi:unnamed protein product [Acanthosepion pharaonis]|uniref:Transmembrane protein n=1 Tax=Acanthosepion pharaonis TaxID=158019 RepID=A0A812BWX7_ACAPH|nr:unnamed protein product [Sepia pharaonis]
MPEIRILVTSCIIIRFYPSLLRSAICDPSKLYRKFSKLFPFLIFFLTFFPFFFSPFCFIFSHLFPSYLLFFFSLFSLTFSSFLLISLCTALLSSFSHSVSFPYFFLLFFLLVIYFCPVGGGIVADSAHRGGEGEDGGRSQRSLLLRRLASSFSLLLSSKSAMPSRIDLLHVVRSLAVSSHEDELMLVLLVVWSQWPAHHIGFSWGAWKDPSCGLCPAEAVVDDSGLDAAH